MTVIAASAQTHARGRSSPQCSSGRKGLTQLWGNASWAQRFSSLVSLALSGNFAYMFAATLDEGNVRSIFWLSASFMFVGLSLVHLASGTTVRERWSSLPLFVHYAIGASFGGAVICVALSFMGVNLIAASGH
ncbi:MAG: hypothetical protein HYV17_00355 [Xanthomonadales bacterium]|nr:hypothetical protein [Xanthomonadales bacterium]